MNKNMNFEKVYRILMWAKYLISLKLCFVLRKFEGKCEKKEIERKSRKKKQVKKKKFKFNKLFLYNFLNSFYFFLSIVA